MNLKIYYRSFPKLDLFWVGISALNVLIIASLVYLLFLRPASPGSPAYNLTVKALENLKKNENYVLYIYEMCIRDRIRYLHNPALAGWSVNGTPSDCVKLAVESLLPEKPSLVISGINQGSNLGTDILYSGTVSAAVEGIILGIPSIAISLINPDESGFDFSAEFACHLIPLLIETGLSLIHI